MHVGDYLVFNKIMTLLMNDIRLHKKQSVFGKRNYVEYVTEGFSGIENTGIHPSSNNFDNLYPFIRS